MALGDNIRERRTQLKMSQEYVAGQLGISRQAVAKWEAGKSEPSAANLAELAALFEMSIGELTDPEKYTREQEAQQKKLKEAQRNCCFSALPWTCIKNRRWKNCRLFSVQPHCFPSSFSRD